MRQSWISTHAETVTQNVLGQFFYFLVLLAFGIPLGTIGGLQVACFFVGYSRSYAVRRFFNWWHHRRPA